MKMAKYQPTNDIFCIRFVTSLIQQQTVFARPKKNIEYLFLFQSLLLLLLLLIYEINQFANKIKFTLKGSLHPFLPQLGSFSSSCFINSLMIWACFKFRFLIWDLPHQQLASACFSCKIQRIRKLLFVF